jgi:hypothetical protein
MRHEFDKQVQSNIEQMLSDKEQRDKDKLRDHFAGLAMQGMLVGIGDWDDEKIAFLSYNMADSMLAEKARRDDV